MLKSNEQRAKIAIYLVLSVLIVEVISLISDFMQYELLQNSANGTSLSMDEANANDTRQQIIGIVYLILYLISAITFIQWFRRAYFNLHTRVNNLTYEEGWAAGAWFVPIVNLFRPFQIMKEMYNETCRILGTDNTNIAKPLTTNALGIWWTLWIISGVLGQVVFRLSRHAETVDDFINLTVLSIISSIITVPLALVTIKVIKDYAAVEPFLGEYTSPNSVSGGENVLDSPELLG